MVLIHESNYEFFFFSAEMTYVNLQLNPERYTGYSGTSTWRIWDAIYKENCPKCEHNFDSFLPNSHFSFLVHSFFNHLSSLMSPDPSEELCSEQKVLYKLISGLHSSITVHIASDYLIDEATQSVGLIS